MASCDNCNKPSHFEVASKSRDHTYHLCLECVLKLKKDPTINHIFVSQNTVDEFRKELKTLVNDAYEQGTIYRISVGTCCICNSDQNKNTFDPEGNLVTIRRSLGYNPNKQILCYPCIIKLL